MACSRLNHPSSWFQLAKMRLTSLRSEFSRRLSAEALAIERRAGGPHRSLRAPAGFALSCALSGGFRPSAQKFMSAWADRSRLSRRRAGRC